MEQLLSTTTKSEQNATYNSVIQQIMTVPQEYLEDIYKQIKEEPLSLPELEEEREKNISDKIEEKYAREKQRIVNEYAFNKKLNNKNSPYIKLKEK